VIATERLILRAPEPRDRDALHAMWADPRVMESLGPVKSGADSDATIARHAAYAPLGFWTVERRDTGEVAGFCGLKPGAPNTPITGMLEIGWMLAAPHWGQGFAREAAAASLAWAWANRDEAEVVAITAARNGKSRALMERLNMVYAPEMDFLHPLFAPGDPLADTVTYRIARP
jgi:RimJ/RimL family protein N-acetyltransferase